MPKNSGFLYVCGACLATSRQASDFCEKCGVQEPWQTEDDREKSAPQSLESIEAVEQPRLPLGELDASFGGGFPLPCSVLVSGLPGAGKSSLALQVAEKFMGEKLYLSQEMPLGLLRAYQVRVAPKMRSMTGWHRPELGEVLAYIAKKAPPIVIFDSLQRAGEDEAEALKALLRVCASVKSSLLVICHATKDGDFAGLLASQHDVDVSLWMRRDEEGCFVQTVKNRFGPAPVEVKLS